jgi:hexulose-6-phosphate isomerase
MERRTFLSGLGALGAAAALPRGFSGQEPAPVAWPKACGLGMVGAGDTLLAKFRLLKELGYDGVEMDAPNGFAPAEVTDARDATGLVIHAVVDSAHWSQPFNHPDPKVRAAGVKALERAIEDAATYGADTVLVVPAVVNKQMAYAEAWDASRAEIARVLPLAAERKVALAIEEVWNEFLFSPLEMARYVDSFASPWVQAYFDVGNVLRFGWPEHWIAALGPRIRRIHVKEYSRKKMNEEGLWKGFDVELHEGDCDWPAVAKALRAAQFRSWLTAEVGGGGRERLARVAADLDRIRAL